MRITDIRTFLVSGGTPGRPGWRHWLFVKVHTDTGLYGVGECWGWPRVVQTAIEDLTPLVVGEDPFLIERIWQKLYASTQGHGMTGVVGSGAITGIELALWDLKGKALDTPVWNLLGGKMRDRIRLYGHAFDEERARELVDRGFTAMKLFGWRDAVSRVQRLRSEYGPEIDLMVDAGGGPWQTPADAISLGRRLERYGLLFYEDPVSAVDIEGLARVAQAVDLPIAIGEAYPDLFALCPLIERGIIDVAQPDTGRFGGLWQMKKLAAIAEAHQVMVAPHQGSLGPVAEMAAIHLLSTLPNYLIHEYLVNDVPQRYEVMTGQPVIEDGHILVPDRPGFGVDLDEEAIERYPPHGNAIPVEEDPDYDYQYVAAHRRRAAWLAEPTEASDDVPETGPSQATPRPSADRGARLDHLRRFYDSLALLKRTLGGERRLSDCTGRMDWPIRGVYFFMETGEFRTDSGSGLRVVRVGTHAVATDSSTQLWSRLSQHRGPARSGVGNHRGSVFRLVVGTSLIKKGRYDCASWGRGSTASREIRDREQDFEKQVTKVIGSMPFLWLTIDDEPGPDSMRAYVERNAIALLSNYEKHILDPPSRSWLGHYCDKEKMRASGLWNSNHVDEIYDPTFLDELERLIERMGRRL